MRRGEWSTAFSKRANDGAASRPLTRPGICETSPLLNHVDPARFACLLRLPAPKAPRRAARLRPPRPCHQRRVWACGRPGRGAFTRRTRNLGETADLRSAPGHRARQRAGPGRRPPAGHDLALVVQGDRHRPSLRDRRHQTHRARHHLHHRPGARNRPARPGFSLCPVNRRPDPRPDDPDGFWQLGGTGGFVQPPGSAPDGQRAGACPGPNGAGGGEPHARPRARRRRDRLPRQELHGPPSRPERHRADDVCPGELRALPPQDFQRHLGDRRRPARPLAVPDDQEHA